MKIAEWFPRWFERHAARHPREDWPRLDDPQGREFWRAFMGNFATRGMVEDIADEASVRLMADPPKFLGEHLPALLVEAKAIWRERADHGRGGHDPSSREAAAFASRDCDDCCGGGLTIRWRKLSADERDEKGNVRSPVIVLYCKCAIGRWFEQAHRKDCPDVRRGIYDLTDYGWLWGDEYRHPPDSSEAFVPAEAF
jgi:hypothetical protein